ncbi:IS200/IS605 family element transposase accessory protein TnpB [Pseudobacteriovorax antillogorgiicola]|uniref:Transposase, IS605 OrfB family, central region n=1 Tax=Pseudobacteriovorax antillogorgiicola TaxID=1513793 RepID=A0A1Y6BSK6_9BACT|nr:IS200/IS605 family element transposase accessory protein TnpB [Pseudobacteriovorax antillogorgiicola]TCS54722.1 IS605 OrfB family transposase [Pseudobacteriovorax antillogorgiicola]SMF15974.1 transposase, IS605 OrfB family, central region [Pseudobacteriovorax antillogorgiicola]
MDSLWKEAVRLSKNHAVIAIEDLKIRNMSRSSKGTIDNPGKMVAQKSGLNRAILREGWYDFEKKLEWQAKKRGARVIYCDPKYNG